MDTQDIIVIGAGISGLSLAHYCAGEGLKTLVIEKSKRTGGTFHSHNFGSETGDFWLELGAHTGYNSYGTFLDLLEDCRVLERIVRREKVSFKMLTGGRIKSIPSELNFVELLLNAPRFFVLGKQGKSIESYYSRVVGRKNFERVFRPALSAVICQECGDFPADMLFQKRPHRKDVLRQYTFKGGLQTAADAVASRGDFRIRTGLAAEKISSDGRVFSVATSGGNFESPMLALAAPASVAARLLREGFPEISELLSRIKVAAVDSLGVAVRKNDIALEATAGLIPVDDIFYSIVSRDTVPHDQYRGFTFHFRPGVADREARMKRIAEVLGLRRDQMELTVECENLVPSLRVGHHELITKLDQFLAGKPLFLAGNYFGGVAIEDCVSRSLKEFQRLKKAL